MSQPNNDIAQVQSSNTFDWGRLGIYWYQQWRDIFRHREMNWIDINIIRFHMENAPYKDTWEINFGFLGFNIGIEWFYGKWPKR